ncbi:MAG: conjugative transposon TraK protein [Chitinophagaceae bacterium]|nr:conjugative transposon TraK protein [Chitinophagaceae bacterium]
MFRQAKNIDTAFQYVRTFTILIVTCCFGLSGYVLYRSNTLSQQMQDRIYVLAGDKVLWASGGTRNENLNVEVRDHVRMFHILFFTLDPDDKVIEAGISKSFYLADASARKQYNALKEAGYYAQVIAGNISQKVIVDSVIIHGNPLSFRFYGKIKITRPSTIVTRNLVTEGVLRIVARSDENPHGLLIERWQTLENKDIKTEVR